MCWPEVNLQFPILHEWAILIRWCYDIIKWLRNFARDSTWRIWYPKPLQLILAAFWSISVVFYDSCRLCPVWSLSFGACYFVVKGRRFNMYVGGTGEVFPLGHLSFLIPVKIRWYLVFFCCNNQGVWTDLGCFPVGVLTFHFIPAFSRTT